VALARRTDSRDTGRNARGGVFAAKSGASRYMQLASVLKHQIASGAWPVGHRLPTVEKMAQDFGLAKITVRQAFAVLAQENLIVSERGRGTYVSSRGQQLDPSLRAAINDVAADTSVLEIRMLEKRTDVQLPPDLGTAAKDYVLVRKLHLHDGEPFCLVEFYVTAELFRQFPRGAEKKFKITRLVREHAAERLGPMHQTMMVEPADYELARLLGCAFSAPIAKIRRITRDVDGNVLSAGTSWYRGDRFVLEMDIPASKASRYAEIAVPERRTT
jgi:GntR family transcriptional regulator